MASWPFNLKLEILKLYLFPKYINSLALLSPINLGNRWVPPAPGIIANDVSGKPKILL